MALSELVLCRVLLSEDTEGASIDLHVLRDHLHILSDSRVSEAERPLDPGEHSSVDCNTQIGLQEGRKFGRQHGAAIEADATST